MSGISISLMSVGIGCAEVFGGLCSTQLITEQNLGSNRTIVLLDNVVVRIQENDSVLEFLVLPDIIPES